LTSSTSMLASMLIVPVCRRLSLGNLCRPLILPAMLPPLPSYPPAVSCHINAGNVLFVSQADATAKNLAFVDPGSQNVILKADNTTVGNPQDTMFGRNSIKLLSKETLQEGDLMILDAVHLPFGVRCVSLHCPCLVELLSLWFLGENDQLTWLAITVLRMVRILDSRLQLASRRRNRYYRKRQQSN
jgi:hypothetical protein